jgi:hypothetical protein
VAAPGARVTLTPEGRRVHQELLAEQLDAGAREALGACYRRFVPLNAEVLALCTDWQLRTGGPEPVVNDHADPDYDRRIFDRLAALAAAAAPVLDELAGVAPRYGAHRDGLVHAAEQVRGGDTAFLTNPRVRCFHTAWFELHEDLLATLGLDRASEERATEEAQR